MACLFIGAWLLVIGQPLVRAESLSVSLRVGDTQISFDGYSSPGAYITIKQNGSVVGTTVADAGGNWVKVIDAYNPGIQSYDLYATDTSSLSTPTISYNVNLPANTLTAISNIVFPPTILFNPTTNLISGMTHPLSELTLILSDSSTYPIVATVAGNWSFDLSQLPAGTYTAYLIATMPGNYISLSSNTITSTITGTPTSSSNPSSSLTPSSSSSPTPSLSSLSPAPKPTLTPHTSAEIALNKILNIFTPTRDLELTHDNLVPIVTRWIDLWRSSLTNPATDNTLLSQQSGSCDLNGDQTCTLTDLSILLYFIKP